jgi:hypothetical protein
VRNGLDTLPHAAASLRSVLFLPYLHYKYGVQVKMGGMVEAAAKRDIVQAESTAKRADYRE